MCECEYSVTMSALDAVNFFKAIQISQVMAVDDHIVAAANVRNAVNRETNPLEYVDEKVKHRDRDQECVDHRRGRDGQRG